MLPGRISPKVVSFHGVTLWTDNGLPGRIFEAILDEVVGSNPHDGGDVGLVVVFCLDENLVSEWFWECLRASATPSMSAVVVVGRLSSKSFHELNPAFLIWPSHQAYIEVGPRFVAEVLEKMESMEAIEDEDVARQIAESGRRGLESRLLYRLHFWKDGDPGSARRDLDLIWGYFLERGDSEGESLCELARTRLKSGRWSPSLGAEFGRKLCDLVRTRQDRRREG